MRQSADYYNTKPMRLVQVVLVAVSVLLLCLDCGAQVPSDERWDVRFGLPGTDNTLVCAAIKGGNLYAGGSFTNAGGTIARGIAKWDGTNWSALPGGFNGLAFNLAVDGN